MDFKLKELTNFLLEVREASVNCDYCFEFKSGEWSFFDSRNGYLSFIGKELVNLRGEPVWGLVYSGCFSEEVRNKPDYLIKVNDLIKKALAKTNRLNPIRGPSNFFDNNNSRLFYFNKCEGGLNAFFGLEQVFDEGRPVYEMHYSGGLIIDKPFRDLEDRPSFDDTVQEEV